MKAYLTMFGFTKVMDIVYPYPDIKIPVLGHTQLYTPDTDTEEPMGEALTFYRCGEVSGGDELILKYKWDGIFPTRSYTNDRK